MERNLFFLIIPLFFLHVLYLLCLFQVSSINPPESTPEINEANPTYANSKPKEEERPLTPALPQPQTQPLKTSSQSQETPKRMNTGITQAFSSPGAQIHKGPTAAGFPNSPQPLRPKAYTIGEGRTTSTSTCFYRYLESIPHLVAENGVSSFVRHRRNCNIYVTMAPSGEKLPPLQTKAQLTLTRKINI